MAGHASSNRPVKLLDKQVKRGLPDNASPSFEDQVDAPIAAHDKINLTDIMAIVDSNGLFVAGRAVIHRRHKRL